MDDTDEEVNGVDSKKKGKDKKKDTSEKKGKDESKGDKGKKAKEKKSEKKR